jgi:aspartyl-tRNA(Asn)/glutamyl-tRNA(Gln) amidotransferase subunit A
VLADRDGTVLAELAGCLEDILLVEAWQVHAPAITGPGADPDRIGATTLRLLRSAAEVEPHRRDAALARRADLGPAADRLLDGVDVLLGPAAPYAAPGRTPPIDTPEGEIEGIFTAPYNVSGQPAIVVPCGLTADGLPVGLQLAARCGDDAGLLRVAAAVEVALS